MSEYAIRALDASTWDAYARLARQAQRVWVRWLLVHVVPYARGQARGRDGPPLEGASRSRGERSCGSGLRRRRRGGMVSIRLSGGASEHPPPEGLRGELERKSYPTIAITCIFVDRDYRRKGVAGVALRGALDLIAKAGGGVVEGYPQDTQGKKISATFLYNTTRSLYEQTGFSYDRPKGKNHCVMRRTV